jgi:hypothetical protein
MTGGKTAIADLLLLSADGTYREQIAQHDLPSRIRPLRPKLFGNCPKTSSQVSVAFRQATNKRCRIGVDPAPVNTCPEAICAGPYTLIVDPRRGVG